MDHNHIVIATKNQITKQSQDVLYRYFSGYFPLNKKEREEVARLFTERTIKRREYLLQEGDVCRQYSFVISGCFKLFAVDPKGLEHNLQFAAENEWIADFQSFYDIAPSKLHIQAMEPSLVLQISHDDLLYLYVNYHKFDRNFRIIIEQKFIELQNRVLQSISSTADERYLTFLKQYPQLMNRLPNTQIASYLGITPQFLSKTRKKIATRKTTKASTTPKP